MQHIVHIIVVFKAFHKEQRESVQKKKKRKRKREREETR